MCDDWLIGTELAMTAEQFQLLPRNPAYGYQYLDGVARIHPRPRYYHAVLALEPPPSFEAADEASVLRPLRAGDWDGMNPVFADAFRNQPPFAHLRDEQRLAAGTRCLAYTQSGGDGPLIEAACYVATDGVERLRGAILVTLFPDGDPSSPASYHWSEPAPAGAVEHRLGRPHLTWIFAAHDAMGRGLGTALLRAAVSELRNLGYRELATTFMLGNTSSLLWHWRMGFRLVAYPFSRRGRELDVPGITLA